MNRFSRASRIQRSASSCCLGVSRCRFIIRGVQGGAFFTSSASDGPQRGDSAVFTFTPPVMMLLPRAQNPLEVKLDQIGAVQSESS